MTNGHFYEGVIMISARPTQKQPYFTVPIQSHHSNTSTGAIGISHRTDAEKIGFQNSLVVLRKLFFRLD